MDDSKIKEIDATTASAARDRFDEILGKVTAAGAKVIKDQETPLYYDAGKDEIEIGRRRLVEFNINSTDFQITRDEKHRRILGVGHKRSFEDLEKPILEMKLRKKDELADDWVYVDIDDLF